MPTPAQTAAAATAVGGGALGGYALSRGLSGGSNKTDSTIQVSTISKPQKDPQTVEKTDSQYTLLTFTKEDHLSHLINPLVATNEEWWKWAYESKYKKHTVTNTLHELFTGLNLPFLASVDASKQEQKALNQACESAYKKAKTDYIFEGSYLLKNISDFCTKDDITFDISKPKVKTYDSNYSASGQEKYGLLGKSNNLSLLVQNISDNDIWWNWAYTYLWKTDNKNDIDDSFKSLVKGYENGSTHLSLNKACSEAYKKPFSQLSKDSQKLFNSVKKFCTIGTTQTSITLPDGEKTVSKFMKDVSDDSTYTSNFVKDNTNKQKLVNPKEEQEWWEWNYYNYFPLGNQSEIGKLRDPFAKVTSAHSADAGSETSLNGACKVAYNKGQADLSQNGDQKETLLTSIQRFCVPVNHKNTALQNPSS